MKSAGLLFALPILIRAGYTDWKKRMISNKAVLALLAAGLLQVFSFSGMIPVPLSERLLVSFTLFLTLFTLYVKSPEKLGGGDVKLLGALGFCSGAVAIEATFVSLIFSLIYALSRGREKSVPFGSMLAAGSAGVSVLHTISYFKMF